MLQPKRLLSLLLALVLVVSLLPAAAFAQDICAHQWEWDEDEGPFYQHCVLCDKEQKLEKIAEEEDMAYQSIKNLIAATRKTLEQRIIPFFRETL